MICPYCNKQIDDHSQFCPECGQEVIRKASFSASAANNYWGTVNKEDDERDREYKQIAERGIKNVKERRRKTIVTIIILSAALIAIVIGMKRFNDHQEQLTDQVKHNLVGKSFTAHSSHGEGLGWIIHEYWDLRFKDDTNATYAYTKTVGPRESGEDPNSRGTYTYMVSRSIFGNYSVRVNGVTFKLNVNNDNVPTGISK